MTYPKLKSLFKFLDSTKYDQEESTKRTFKRLGMAGLKELAHFINPPYIDIAYNPWGIAVSGDLILRMFNNEGFAPWHWVEVHLAMDYVTPKVMYRTIEHLADSTGGQNNWWQYDNSTIDQLIDRVTQLYNNNPHLEW